MSDYDALAELFLSDGGPAMKPRAATGLKLTGQTEAAGEPPPSANGTTRTPTRTIEGLILGHLPVLGAAWVMQYAKHLGEASGHGVALLRVQGGQASVDVVLPRTAAHTRADPAVSERATLREAIDAAAAVAPRWLVRVDDTNEPDLLGTPGLSGVTLLTGADDAAVVASYRTMKGLCSLEKEDGHGVPALSLAVMGAADDKAGAAEGKLRRASMTFLGRDIDTVAHVAKIGPGSATPYFRGDWAGTLAEAVTMIRTAQPATPAAAHQTQQTNPPHVVRPPSPQPAVVVEQKPALVSPPPLAPANVTRPVAPPARPSSGGTLPEGLAPLATSCPYAPSVRLASGPGGTLHLLASGDAVRELLVAASWAGEHAGLLAAAFPALSAPAIQSGPTLHVLTDDARAVRGLLDTAVRVHLLVEVPGGSVVRALN